MAKMPGKAIEFACEQQKETPDAVLKALSSLNTTEEKLAALCKKYADLVEENRAIQVKAKQFQKAVTTVMKEKDSLQVEHTKVQLAKSKLESLCRELQRHNKLVKEESLARAKEEEEKRKEVSNKFQKTINDIQAQMNDHYQKNSQLREENLEMAGKLKKLIEQYDLREEHVDKILKHKDLEKQLLEAKLQQAALQLKEEQTNNLAHREQLMKDVSEAHGTIKIMEENEKHLREQVNLYTSKYEEFQQTLSKSNEVFSSFKSEMEKMTKKIKKLERETNQWKLKWENANRSLIGMAEEKTRNDQEIGVLHNKVKRLESLCRALQAERKQASVEQNNPDASEALPAECVVPTTASDSCHSEEGTVACDTQENIGIQAADAENAVAGDSVPEQENKAVPLETTEDAIEKGIVQPEYATSLS